MNPAFTPQPDFLERPQPLRTPTVKDVVELYVLTSILLISYGVWLQQWHLLIGLIVTELLLVVAPPLLQSWWQGYDVAQTFHWSPISRKLVWLTIVTMTAAFVLVGALAFLQEQVLPQSAEYQELWQEALQQFQQLPLLLTLSIIAVLPGLCEELLFRGFMLSGLRRRFSDTGAILIAAVLFGIFHFDPYRLLPVTVLGVFFGVLVVKTESILTAMIAHATNNTIAILISYASLSQAEKALPPTEALPESWTLAQLLPLLSIFVLAALIFWVGLRTIFREGTPLPKVPPDTSPDEVMPSDNNTSCMRDVTEPPEE